MRFQQLFYFQICALVLIFAVIQNSKGLPPYIVTLFLKVQCINKIVFVRKYAGLLMKAFEIEGTRSFVLVLFE